MSRAVPIRIVAALLVGAVLATTAACSTPRTRWVDPPGGSSNGPGGTGTVSWRPCPEVAEESLGQLPKNVTFECGTVRVPQDWHHPGNGSTFDIALMRAHAAGQSGRIGSLLVNPGGPGGSGVQLAAYLSQGLPAEVTRRFDLVGFDPRGVGKSSPVECISDADKDANIGFEPDPASQPQFDRLVQLTRQMAEDCQSRYRATLGLFATEQAVRDMDAIRGALGDEKLTFLGYSYGTLLGAVYAHLFPRRVRALVLDGAVDPRENDVAASEGQAAGFENAFNQFAAWCKVNATLCPIGPDARRALTAILGKVRSRPLRAPDGRQVTPGWVFTAVVSALYSRSQWPVLGGALGQVNRGDPDGVLQLVDLFYERDSHGHYTNLIDANSAINCVDETDPPSVAEVRRYQSDWRKKYPLFGAPLALSMLACSVWPATRDPYPVGAADGAPPILVVGTRNDPATPYAQTARLASLLGTGTVLTWEGDGHTAYPQTACVTSAVDGYLVDLKVPDDNTSCPAR